MTLRAAFQMVTAKTQVLAQGGILDKNWYVLLYSIYNAVTQGQSQAAEAVTLGASPFVYQAVIRSQVFVNGGTVSAVEFSRDGTTYYPATSPVQLSKNDFLRVTYSVAPALVAVPL